MVTPELIIIKTMLKAVKQIDFGLEGPKWIRLISENSLIIKTEKYFARWLNIEQTRSVIQSRKNSDAEDYGNCVLNGNILVTFAYK